MRVLFVPEIQDYFYELENILYGKGYFSFEDAAIKYVDDLIYDIKTNLPSKHHKPAPKHYKKYGKELYYTVFKKTNARHGTPSFPGMPKMAKQSI